MLSTLGKLQQAASFAVQVAKIVPYFYSCYYLSHFTAVSQLPYVMAGVMLKTDKEGVKL